MRMNRRAAGLTLALFGVAFAIRSIFAAQLIFPPLDDPAFYVQTARNVAAGRGLIIDVIWNYFVPFANVTHPSHEFWMPLPTLLMALSMRLCGDSLLAAQLPGIIGGALLPALTFGLGRRMFGVDRWALLAALLAVPSAISVYQSASADSAAVYAILSAGALGVSALVLTDAHRRYWLAGLTGLLCGLSYLTRSHGGLLAVAIGGLWLIEWRRERVTLLKSLAAAIIGGLIMVGPWWLRNLQAFGSLQPFPLTLAAAATDYGAWFNYTQLPSMTDVVANGAALQVRWAALWHDLDVMLLVTFPFGLIGLPVVLMRREKLFRLVAIYALLIWLTVSGLFPIPALTGSFYHSTGTLVPFAALGTMMAIRGLVNSSRWRLAGVGLYAVMLALVIGQAAIAWPGVIVDSRANATRFGAVTQWLRSNVPPDQPIITNEAHSLNYASGYSTLTLPNQQAVPIVRQLADRYGARFVVVFGAIGQYPAALEQVDRIVLRANLDNVTVYEFQP